MVTNSEPGDGGSERLGAAALFVVFLRLGLTSFGGPVAHLGYFRETLVVRRRWLTDEAYAELVALCQFLPGPASSQVAFAFGLQRSGWLGGLAAWLAFSLPSVALMTAFAFGVAFAAGPLAAGALDGLKLVAVAIVAQAVAGMARTLTPDWPRSIIALVALCALILVPAGTMQLAVIALGAVAGLALRIPDVASGAPALGSPLPRRAGVVAFTAFLALLLLPPLIQAAAPSPIVAYFDGFYRSGALVFGGGHVVLPLLHEAVVEPGWIDEDRFLAGYGAAQALPGPLFAFAAFLGAGLPAAPSGIWGAMFAFGVLSAPGLLILTAALPFWTRLRGRASAWRAMAGANAAVVGALAAALYNPIGTGAIKSWLDLTVAAAGFVLLTRFRASPIVVVALGAACGVARAALA
jgi:chromate transporter